MAEDLQDDPERLRAGVRANYRALAVDPRTIDQFNTGRHLAAKLGYHAAIVDALPDRAVESIVCRAETLRHTAGIRQKRAAYVR